jgi:hypothetical protein
MERRARAAHGEDRSIPHKVSQGRRDDHRQSADTIELPACVQLRSLAAADCRSGNPAAHEKMRQAPMSFSRHAGFTH